MKLFLCHFSLYNISIIVIYYKYLSTKDRFPLYIFSHKKNVVSLVSDKNTTNKFQEPFTSSLSPKNITHLGDTQSQSLKTAEEQLKKHLSSNYGFSNLDEYNSYILPPNKILETVQNNILPTDEGI